MFTCGPLQLPQRQLQPGPSGRPGYRQGLPLCLWATCPRSPSSRLLKPGHLAETQTSKQHNDMERHGSLAFCKWQETNTNYSEQGGRRALTTGRAVAIRSQPRVAITGHLPGLLVVVTPYRDDVFLSLEPGVGRQLGVWTANDCRKWTVECIRNWGLKALIACDKVWPTCLLTFILEQEVVGIILPRLNLYLHRVPIGKVDVFVSSLPTTDRLLLVRYLL